MVLSKMGFIKTFQREQNRPAQPTAALFFSLDTGTRHRFEVQNWGQLMGTKKKNQEEPALFSPGEFSLTDNTVAHPK